MKKSLCFLNILLTTFIMVTIYFIPPWMKIFPYYYFLFFFYHFLLLNHKTQMDHTMSYYRYPKVTGARLKLGVP